MLQNQYQSTSSYRPSRFAQAPACKWLLILLVFGFLLDVVNAKDLPFGRRIFPFTTLFLDNGLFSGEVWRLVLFPITDLNLGGLIFSGLVVFGFGIMVEQSIDTKKFIQLIITSVIFAAVVFILTTLLAGKAGSFGLYGASCIAFAIVSAAAFFAPNMVVRMLIPPVSVKLSTIAAIIVGLGVLTLVSSKADWTASLANLSTIAVGWYFVKQSQQSTSRKKKPSKKKRSVKQKPTYEAKIKPRTTIDLKAEEAIDKILDKVNNEGIGSLSDKERKLLLKASDKK